MNRGRPRHDDILTPRQWQVLALLREGLSNEAIAERLGISADTAKFHVSEILTKLGVRNRQEAARWRGEPRRRQAWAVLLYKPSIAAAVAITLILVFTLASGRLAGTERGNGGEALPGEALVDFEAPPDSTTTPQQPLETVASLPVRVCSDEPAWQRPTEEDHAAYIRADLRWSGYDERAQQQFAAHFWSIGSGASGAGFALEFSGLWNLPNEGRDFYWAAGERCRDFDFRRSLMILSLEHTIVGAGSRGHDVQIRVRNRETGAQIVTIELPFTLQESPTIEFVDERGAVIERLVEPLWSTAP